MFAHKEVLIACLERNRFIAEQCGQNRFIVSFRDRAIREKAPMALTKKIDVLQNNVVKIELEGVSRALQALLMKLLSKTIGSKPPSMALSKKQPRNTCIAFFA